MLQNAGNREKTDELYHAIKERTRSTMNVYHTVAVHFVDLHGTTERLLEKNASAKLYHGERREAGCTGAWFEHSIAKRIVAVVARRTLCRWFVEDKFTIVGHLCDNNMEAVSWLLDQAKPNSVVESNIAAIKKDAIISQTRRSCGSIPISNLNPFIDL